MKQILVLALLLSASILRAQSISMTAISSGGDSYSNGAGSISFTVGETSAGPVSNGNLMICQGFQQTYITYWVGNADNNWNNALNWSGGPVPDLHTDLVILPARPQFPLINSNVSCRSLQTLPGSSVNVQTGFTLIVTH